MNLGLPHHRMRSTSLCYKICLWHEEPFLSTNDKQLLTIDDPGWTELYRKYCPCFLIQALCFVSERKRLFKCQLILVWFTTEHASSPYISSMYTMHCGEWFEFLGTPILIPCIALIVLICRQTTMTYLYLNLHHLAFWPEHVFNS